MKTYRIKYSFYRLEANSAEEATAKAVKMYRDSPESFISAELDTDKKPLIKKFITGP